MFYNELIDVKNFNLYMERLKKLNSDFILLQDRVSSSSKFFSLRKYIMQLNLKKIFRRTRIFFYEKKYQKNCTINDTIIENKNKAPNYFLSKHVVIYTSIYGSYDQIKDPIFIPDNCEFVIFTDMDIPATSVWKKNTFTSDEFDALSNVEKNRFIKMHPHLLFKDRDYSIYVDGSIQIITDLTEMINNLTEIGVSTHLHCLRKCVYDEIQANLIYGKINKELKSNYLKLYKQYNMPRGYGMLECGVIAREHNNELCVSIMEEWWDIFRSIGGRDQLSLPLVLYNHGILIDNVGTLGIDIYHNYSFRINQHKQ